MRGIVAPQRDGVAGFAEQLGERRAPRARAEDSDVHGEGKRGKRPTLNFQCSTSKVAASLSFGSWKLSVERWTFLLFISVLSAPFRG